MSKPARPVSMQMPSRPPPLQRDLVTPEGVPLHLELAGAGDRAVAFILDIFFMFLIMFAMGLAAVAAASTVQHKGVWEAIGVAMFLVFFILRNFYFTLFEMGPRAATPGKRIVGLRVTSRNGGRLTAGAIIARNAMREIEIFMPLGFLFMGGGERVAGWLALLGLLWSGIFLFMPLFNRDKLRAGDMIAGTWVIRNPKAKLAKDMAETNRHAHDDFDFTPAELDAYGVHELQVLEGVLRRNEPKALSAVAERIRKKIGRQRKNNEKDADFLAAYYAGLRKTLEGKLLFGVRRKDKFDRR